MGMLGGQVADRRANPAQRLRVGVQPAQLAIGQHDLQARYMVGCHAVLDAMRASGVVANDAADCGSLGAGGVRTKHQVQGRQLRIQRAEDQSRLDIDRARLGIDSTDAPHVPREVHDDGFADGLPGQGAATAARQNRQPMYPRNLVHGHHIIGIARESHSQGHDLVVAGVSAVEDARHLVGGGMLAPQRGLQLM